MRVRRHVVCSIGYTNLGGQFREIDSWADGNAGIGVARATSQKFGSTVFKSASYSIA